MAIYQISIWVFTLPLFEVCEKTGQERSGTLQGDINIFKHRNAEKLNETNTLFVSE